MSHRRSMPRVYYYRLRQQHAGFEADDGLRYRGGEEADHKATEGAGVFAREEVPNQNQNQVFSLENEESDDFLEEEQLKPNPETAKERPVLPEEVSKPASKSSWLWQVWSLLLAIAHLIRSIYDICRTIWTTKTYRYGLLGALLLGLLFYLWHQPGAPVSGETKPVVPSPYVKQEEDHLPLNVEILVKRLLDQQLNKKSDDILARVMQKMAADKEELRRRSKEELLRYIDDKLNKVDTLVRSRLNAAPATDDFSKEMKELEARMKSELQRLTREVSSGKDGASDTQRGLQTQIDTIQQRIVELTRSLENQPQATTGPSAIEQTLPAELQELRTGLTRLLDEHQRMTLRMEDQDAEAARLREHVAQLVSTENLNAELVRVREAIQEALSAAAAAAAAHPPTQPAQLDQEVLVTTVLAKVLARWDIEKQSLIDDLRARDQQAGQVAGEPVDMTRHKDTIMAWVHETIARELKGVEGSVAQLQARLAEGALTPAQPQAEQLSAEQIVTNARVLIQQYIKEQHDQRMPEVIQSTKAQILPDINERILSGEEQTAKALDDQRKQIDALGKRQTQLDASLRTVAKERSTMVLSDEQLREVVRMLNANRAVSSHALAEEQVREIVREELDVFAADRVNMTDWALGAAGARILPAYTSDRYGNSLLALVLGQVSEPPSAILTTSLTPGHCWAFGGDHGNATIQLPCRVRPTAFTVDHIARGVARDFRSAPQHFRVWGFEDQAALADETKAVLLGEYRYDIYGPQVQTFPVQYARPAEEQEDEEEALLGSSGFKVIKMGVFSNYGHEDFTCVYRFRVHGSLDA